MEPPGIEAINDVLKVWAPKVRTALKSNTVRLSEGKELSFVTRGKRIEKKLTLSISYKIHYSFGVADSVGFQFERHGVFVQKGVGRKYPLTGKQPVSNPSGNERKPYDWFNSLLDKEIPELANKIAEINADLSLNAARMQIH